MTTTTTTTEEPAAQRRRTAPPPDPLVSALENETDPEKLLAAFGGEDEDHSWSSESEIYTLSAWDTRTPPTWDSQLPLELQVQDPMEIPPGFALLSVEKSPTEEWIRARMPSPSTVQPEAAPEIPLPILSPDVIPPQPEREQLPTPTPATTEEAEPRGQQTDPVTTPAEPTPKRRGRPPGAKTKNRKTPKTEVRAEQLRETFIAADQIAALRPDGTMKGGRRVRCPTAAELIAKAQSDCLENLASDYSEAPQAVFTEEGTEAQRLAVEINTRLPSAERVGFWAVITAARKSTRETRDHLETAKRILSASAPQLVAEFDRLYPPANAMTELRRSEAALMLELQQVRADMEAIRTAKQSFQKPLIQDNAFAEQFEVTYLPSGTQGW
jgi:hypothetical protein